MLYPLTFKPEFKERVWGGRKLESLYGKPLPADVRIGESWEVSDRPDTVSVIASGPLAGRDLRWLMENHASELMGDAESLGGRFPLLVKILDAQEKLSLQVHPPAHLASRLGGEPKTEMWYIADSEPGAELFVGLKRGVTRSEFEEKSREGTVASCFHRIEVRGGDAMFLPSGRVHAIGAGSVIFEIQQNSDTTYRVFDWNRLGLDGKPRELHLEQSLASIDFSDFEPGLIGDGRRWIDGNLRRLVPEPLRAENGPSMPPCQTPDCPFEVEMRRIASKQSVECHFNVPLILGVVRGSLAVRSSGAEIALGSGQFALLPACLSSVELTSTKDAEVLIARPAISHKHPCRT